MDPIRSNPSNFSSFMPSNHAEASGQDQRIQEVSKVVFASSQNSEPVNESELATKAQTLDKCNSSLKALVLKIINWLRTTISFSWFKPLYDLFKGKPDVPFEHEPSQSSVLQTIEESHTSDLPSVDEILDKIGDKDKVDQTTWSRSFKIDSNDKATFNRTLRSFSSHVRQYDDVIGQRKFKLTIEGKEYVDTDHESADTDHESADTALKRFFGVEQVNNLPPESQDPLNIAKYYIVNGVGNLVDDDRFLEEGTSFSKNAEWLIERKILVGAEDDLSEIRFFKEEDDLANVFRFEIIDIAKIQVYKNGEFTPLPVVIKVEKKYAVTLNPDESCTIEGTKTIKKQ